jgi:hypothetical protein
MEMTKEMILTSDMFTSFQKSWAEKSISKTFIVDGHFNINCFECKKCKNCIECIDCDFCDNCYECKNCDFCDNCSFCSDCKKCSDSIDLKKMFNVKNKKHF